MIRHRPLRRALALVFALAAACRSGGTTSAPTAGGPTDEAGRPFHEATPGLHRQARELIAEVPAATPKERIALSARITALGEPGTQALIEALSHPDPTVRAFAAWTLGFAGDTRAVGPLRRATGDPAPLVSLEAAAARVRLGDDGGIVRLVEGLEDPDPRIRSRCILILQNRTGRTYDYLPDDPPAERAAAVERWRVFLKQRGLSG